MSSLSRQLACAGFQTVVLEEERPFSPNAAEAAVWGNAIHAIKEGKPVQGTVEGLPGEDEAAALRAMYAGWEHEVHLGYELCQHAGYRFRSDAAKKEMCNLLSASRFLTGCTDAMAVNRASDTLWVNDLKTGEEPVYLDEPQLLGYLLTLFTWGLRERLVTKSATLRLSVLHYPREGWWRKKYEREDGAPWRWTERVVTVDELRAFRARLTEMLPKVEAGLLQASDECVFCPGHATCPLWATKRQ